MRPLALTVPLPGGAVALGDDLPAPGGSGCAARAQARGLAMSADGQHLAFLVHRCDGPCAGRGEFDGEWFVVVHDLVRSSVRVVPGALSAPHGLALADSGAVAVSARRGGDMGVWLCASDCSAPKRLAKGTFLAVQFRADGRRLVGVEINEREPVQVAVG